MVLFDPLWKTMSSKNFTTYTLREKHGIRSATVQRLKKNMHVSTYTLDKLCKLLDCRIEDIVEFIPDE